MKILQINKYFYLKGGAETVFFNTIELLKQQGHTVIPFCLKSEKNYPSEYESFFVDYPELSESGLFTKIKNTPYFIYNKKAVTQLEKLLEIEKPDIVHIHLLFNSMSVSILPILKKHNIPVVMTVHDYRLICPAYSCTDGAGRICERCLLSKKYWQCITNKCSKGNIMNSTLLALDSYFRSYFINPLDYINQFIFVSKFSQNKHTEADVRFKEKSIHLYNFTLIESTEEDKKKNDLLFLGRVSEEKGIDTLLKAIEGLPNTHLKIAGTGPLIEILKKRSSSNVEFLGFKQGNELKQYIQNARFVIVPSEWYENNPLAIIESMSLGTPVIGSRMGGIPELIDDAVTGYLFDAKSSVNLRETIQKAISITSDEYKTMSANAKSFARDNFSKEVHAEKLLQIYHSVIKKHKQ